MTSDDENWEDKLEESMKNIERRMEEFNNRTIYTSLDLETLASIPDDKLEQAIIDYIYTKDEDDWEDFREYVDSLPESFRGLFCYVVGRGRSQ